MTPAIDPTRNLVVCCDGTGNIWGNSHDTNVVKLARACVKDREQIVYYDPGVGTASGFPPVGVFDDIVFKVKLLAGLAFAGGIYENIASAYAFLVYNYRPGDRIFLVGFSRGAFTARSVSGMVNLFGIVRPAGEVMIPTLLRIYFSDKDKKDERGRTRQDNADDIRLNFTDPVGHEARVYAIGVWDTVATVGGLRSRRISSDASTANKRFDHVRHAVSEGEYRAQYEPRPYGGENRNEPGFVPDGNGGLEYRPSLKQLYFAGVHSDVGGSYPQAGLSDIALHWMLEELHALGLRLRPRFAADAHPDPLACTHDQAMKGFFGPWWALTRLQRRAPPAANQRHDSLRHREEHPEAAPVFWKPLLRNPAFLVPLGLAIGLEWLAWHALAGVSPGNGTGVADFMRPRMFGFEGHGASDTVVQVVAGALASFSLWRSLSVVATMHLLCIGCVQATGRLRHVDPTNTAFHSRLGYVLWVGLLGVTLGGLLQVPVDAWFFRSLSPWVGGLASLLAIVRFLAALALAGSFVLAWVRGRPPACIGVPADD